jgi:hypothetical protein
MDLAIKRDFLLRFSSEIAQVNDWSLAIYFGGQDIVSYYVNRIEGEVVRQ